MTLKSTLESHAQAIQETMKLAPPIAITGAGAAGIDWQTWVLILTACYTILLILHKCFQIYKDFVRFNKDDPDSAMGKLR
jgi:hypothetical protein